MCLLLGRLLLERIRNFVDADLGLRMILHQTLGFSPHVESLVPFACL
jgi:hypothetical protein